MSIVPPKLSVVIPCYNEKAAIATTVTEIREALKDMGAYELIVVDDGSVDGSAEILEFLVEGQPKLKVCHHEENRGYGAALKTGMRLASGELIAITDADGTYPNEQIPELVKRCADVDMVIGARTGLVVEYSMLRRIPKVFLGWYCSWITGSKIPDFNSGLRVFKKSVAEQFRQVLPNTFSFTTTITLAMLTNDFSVQYVPVNYSARIGKSKIRPIKDTLQFMQLILRTGMYFAPLRAFAPLIGMLTVAFVVSLAYDIIIQHNLTDKTLILLILALNTALFALLADVIDKRTRR